MVARRSARWAAALAAVLATSVIVPAGAACEWPLCTRRCLPCKEKLVGSCKIFGCSADHGPTDCFLGRCLCGAGYCASLDGYHCEPQVCFPGATPPEFEPKWWVKVFAALGGSSEFPPPDVLLGDGGGEFAVRSCTAAIILLVFGLLVALLTCGCLCRKGDPQLRKQMVLDSKESEALDSPASPKRSRRPSSTPMLTSAFVILVATLSAIYIRYNTFQHAMTIFEAQFHRAYADVNTVIGEVIKVNNTCVKFEHNLRELGYSCANVGNQLGQLTTKAGDAIAQYIDEVESISALVAPIPGQMEAIQREIVNQEASIAWGPMMPLALIVMCTALIVVEAVFTERFGTSTIAEKVDIGLRVASMVFFVLIVITAVVAATTMALGVGVSQFCLNLDENVLSYVEDLTGVSDGGNASDQVYNITRFYVAGDVYNPVLGHAEAAENYMNQIVGIYQDLNFALVQINIMCPALSDLDFQGIKDEVLEILDKLRGIVSANNIWPYYSEMVQKFTCGSMVHSCFWIVVFQFLIGIVFFPICAELTHSFLVRWSVWRECGGEEDEDDVDDGFPKPSYHQLVHRLKRLEAENQVLQSQLPGAARSVAMAGKTR